MNPLTRSPVPSSTCPRPCRKRHSLDVPLERAGIAVYQKEIIQQRKTTAAVEEASERAPYLSLALQPQNLPVHLEMEIRGGGGLTS